MKKLIKKNYARYLQSSGITFLAFFLPPLLIVWKDFDVETLSKASLFAFAGVIARLVIKALWETGTVYLTKLIVYLKQKYGK